MVATLQHLTAATAQFFRPVLRIKKYYPDVKLLDTKHVFHSDSLPTPATPSPTAALHLVSVF
jgi:hypothetical protein